MSRIMTERMSAINTSRYLELDICDTEKTVVQRIFEHALKNPDSIAIIAQDKETPYRELADMILSIHNWLKSKGVMPGNCVSVQAAHEDICIACYYAVHLTGAILVPLEKSASAERMREISDETGSVLIICIHKESDTTDRWVSYEQLSQISHSIAFSRYMDVMYPDIDSPCEMVFTTGTTGKSKGTLMTHRSISWYAYSIAKRVEMKKDNRFLIPTPLNHAGGLRRTHLSLANGCCVVYLDGLGNLARYFRYIRQYRVTSLYLPPVAVRILLSRTGDRLSEFQNQIDFVYSSSSSLPTGDCEAMRRLLPYTRLYNAYEASETPGVSAYDYNLNGIRKDCMGKANVGVEIGILLCGGRIISDRKKGVLAAPGTGGDCDSATISEEGQICIRSVMNMEAYYNEPELTASVLKDGWFVSNDLGCMDEYGRIYYRGRLGDVINIGGYKIAPTDVEEVALLSGQVRECVCVEDLDNNGFPFLKLIVVPDEGSTFDPVGITHFMADRLESYKVPQVIEITKKIVRTFNGKIDRKAYKV